MPITAAITALQAEIQQTATASGRTADAVTLVAVSKTQPLEAIIAAYDAGLRHFGENRADELANKAAALSHLPDIHWHFIGRLQTRQSLAVAQYATSFHAVDRRKIAQRLAQQCAQLNRVLPIFLQVNISGEASKTGFICDNWENDKTQQNNLLAVIDEITALDNVQIFGLMTMAPANASNAAATAVFSRTRALAEWLTKARPSVNFSALSMGMSGDFMPAIEQGATHVRIGSKLFRQS